MQDLVSVIVPVYNSEKLIRKSLESMLQQAYENFEIIVIDDGSVDNSFQIAKSFESPKCKVLRQENSGPAIARNVGLANASGKYIQFLDIDDYLSPTKIARQVAALENERGKVAVCNYINFTADAAVTESALPTDQSGFIFSSDNPAEFLLNLWGGNGKSNFIQTNSWLTPRSVIDKAGGWRNYRCPDDDGEFFTRVLLASQGIVYVPGVYNFYQRSDFENKLSTNSAKKYIHNTLLTIDLKYAYLKNALQEKAADRAFAKQYLDFAVYNYPRHKVFSKIALKRYHGLRASAALPLLGGKFFQSVADVLGWKAARALRYYLREK